MLSRPLASIVWSWRPRNIVLRNAPLLDRFPPSQYRPCRYAPAWLRWMMRRGGHLLPTSAPLHPTAPHTSGFLSHLVPHPQGQKTFPCVFFSNAGQNPYSLVTRKRRCGEKYPAAGRAGYRLRRFALSRSGPIDEPRPSIGAAETPWGRVWRGDGGAQRLPRLGMRRPCTAWTPSTMLRSAVPAGRSVRPSRSSRTSGSASATRDSSTARVPSRTPLRA